MNVVETIALHLKQITISGIKVEVSTDSGATWTPSDSSQNDDHFITLHNRHKEVIHVQARLNNACNNASEVLSEDVATTPTPSAPISITPAGTVSASSSINRELVIGASLLVALVIAAFFVGA